MSDIHNDRRGYAFGDFVVDIDEGLLIRDGDNLPLGRSAFNLLRYLVERSGSIVEKRELVDLLGGDGKDAEYRVAECLAEVRRAIDDEPGEIIRIATGGGYMLDLKVHPLSDTKKPDLEAVNPADPTRPERGGRIASLIALILLSLIWVILALVVGQDAQAEAQSVAKTSTSAAMCSIRGAPPA